MTSVIKPQTNVLSQVRAGFVLRGTTLHAWCRKHKIDPGYAHKILSGKNSGPSAILLKRRLLDASSAK